MTDYARIESVDQVDELFDRSHEKPVLIFKHSLICPISGAAFGEYRKFLAERASDDGAVYTLVEIQNARDVSSELAARTGVRHESPQALVLRAGEVTWHASHGSIRADALAAALDE